jgi:predicted acetyltransferase
VVEGLKSASHARHGKPPRRVLVSRQTVDRQVVVGTYTEIALCRASGPLGAIHHGWSGESAVTTIRRMPELIEPTTNLYAAFRDCRADWGPGDHEDGFGIDPADDVDSPAGFGAWVERMLSQTHPAAEPCPDRPHWSPRWIVEGDRILGGFAMRHRYDDLRGYIGYGVRPSARRRGLASWALGRMLDEARDVLRLDRVLMVCAVDNVASARTIERCGGVLEGIRDTALGPQRRYWKGSSE